MIYDMTHVTESVFTMSGEFQNFSSSTDERIYDHPSLADYYVNLTPFIMVSIVVAMLLLVINICIWLTTINNIRKELDVSQQNRSILLCSLYPLICTAALITILLPKAWLVGHTVMHLCFTVGAVAFQRSNCDCISDGNYLKDRDGITIGLNTPPCCCCCVCLPTLTITSMKLCILRYMVWQMPIIQGIIMLTLNVIYYNTEGLYNNMVIYFMPFIVCSILVGIWALNITVRMLNNMQTGYNLMKKMFCLQLILILCKLQYMILDKQLDSIVLGGSYPMNHPIYKQTVINILIMIEMILVSMLVQNAYKTSPPINVV